MPDRITYSWNLDHPLCPGWRRHATLTLARLRCVMCCLALPSLLWDVPTRQDRKSSAHPLRILPRIMMLSFVECMKMLH